MLLLSLPAQESDFSFFYACSYSLDRLLHSFPRVFKVPLMGFFVITCSLLDSYSAHTINSSTPRAPTLWGYTVKVVIEGYAGKCIINNTHPTFRTMRQLKIIKGSPFPQWNNHKQPTNCRPHVNKKNGGFCINLPHNSVSPPYI